MDTIFVKSVKDQGPAVVAGLNIGDRIVSVNGETVSGRSYAQVVQMIQKSRDSLFLVVVPRQDDVLQVVGALSIITVINLILFFSSIFLKLHKTQRATDGWRQVRVLVQLQPSLPGQPQSAPAAPGSPALSAPRHLTPRVTQCTGTTKTILVEVFAKNLLLHRVSTLAVVGGDTLHPLNQRIYTIPSAPARGRGTGCPSS